MKGTYDFACPDGVGARSFRSGSLGGLPLRSALLSLLSEPKDSAPLAHRLKLRLLSHYSRAAGIFPGQEYAVILDSASLRTFEANQLAVAASNRILGLGWSAVTFRCRLLCRRQRTIND